MHPDPNDIRRIIQTALEEDVGPGDVTSDRILPKGLQFRGILLVKEAGVVAGLTVAQQVFEIAGDATLSPSVTDGTRVESRTTLGIVTGEGRTILRAERVALNILQRMSGIALTTRRYVDAVEGTKARILDTRKTMPGLRVLDKMAVRIGGGSNHRVGLFDMVLIKDNHIDACGSISEAVSRARRGSPSLPIEVECRSLDDVREAIPLKLDRLLLDNMDPTTVRKAVEITGGAVPLEVSGNIRLENVRSYAETGVDFISVGALTHSAPALDISLKLSP